MNNRISVATIQSPEFINLQESEISPLISKCEIKVLYVGQNRNMSYITKEVATEMSKTLRGCPIVGYYIESKEDFGDHGDQVIIDGEGIKFNTLTKPYGFVAPDAKVWFQFFEDQDEFGNTCLREYLMAEGYLWTGQFEECQRVLENKNPQSMELDEKSLKGHWSTDVNQGIDFFIINDAVFSKLCILGEDVEPCFEGANVSAPELSSNFSKNDNFTKSLFTMMNELKFALKNSEGGQSMFEETQGGLDNVDESTSVENQDIVETPVEQNEETSAEVGEIAETPEVEIEAPAAADEVPTSIVESACKDDDDEKEKFEKEEDKEDESESEKSKDNTEDDDDEDDKKFALEQELSELKSQFAALQEENKKLLAFKQEVEEKEKDALIASFYMLSDEDKKDVIENKANYSLKEIKAELSMICVDKKVNFSLEGNSENETPITYNLNAHQADSLPAWLRAVENTRNAKNK